MGLEEKARRSKFIERLQRVLDEHSKTYEIHDDVPGEIRITYPVVADAEPEAAPELEPAAVPLEPDPEGLAASDTPTYVQVGNRMVPLAALRKRASELEIPGRSSMTRDELVAALEAAE